MLDVKSVHLVSPGGRMQANAFPDAPAQAANILIAHLRAFPDDATQSHEDLAAKLELDPHFVEQVLQALEPVEPSVLPSTVSLAFLGEWKDQAIAIFDHWIINPRRFIVGTLVACVLVSVGLDALARLLAERDVRVIPDLLFGANLLCVLATGTVHMGCYFRKGMVRYVLVGSALLWILLSAIMLLQMVRSGVDLTSQLNSAILVAIGSGILSLVYGAFGCVLAVTGAWIRLRGIVRREEAMSRQELLERYFDLQYKIKSESLNQIEAPAWTQWAAVEAFQESPYFWSLFFGALLSLTTVLIAGPTNVNPMRMSWDVNAIVYVALGILGLLNFLIIVLIGFLSRTASRAVVCSLVFSAVSLGPKLIPLGPFGLRYFADGSAIFQAGISSFSMALVALIAAMGAQVQLRSQREKSLQRNDQATVAAEMLRIHWRLSGGTRTICVLVVDAARSSEMKTNADPLAVEYSFREYQDWVETICSESGGSVHSTAGDGAIVSFDDCKPAYDAARRMQTDLARFNRDVNELRQPFRLRIGLHTGEVDGTLDEIEFTHVIDVAAHVQSVAPTSGIAVTQDVVAELGDEDFVQMAKEVDGHRVHLALNPIED